MSPASRDDREAIWSSHNEELRDPAEIIGLQHGLRQIDPRLFAYETGGKWWDILQELDVTLIVTREYEHLLLCLRVDEKDGPITTMMPMPHPSGLAVDRHRGVVHVACTRNPNLVYDLMPQHGSIPRLDAPGMPEAAETPLLPVKARFLPGCLYIHDLAMVGGELYANSVGQNAVVRLFGSGRADKVWWPKCIERGDGPIFGRNHLQLNSIAAGDTLEDSFFSASTDEVTELRPGDPSFPVDGRGVIFSGASREPIVRGLTRPHSARLIGGRIWVDNSGYGEVGFVDRGRFQPVVSLPGWTRGLCFCGKFMFVGTSGVLPRFRQYAPGLDVDTSVCGIHAIDVESGRVSGSILWPYGSQIFSIEWVPASFSTGAPFRPDRSENGDAEKAIFYAFQVTDSQED